MSKKKLEKCLICDSELDTPAAILTAPPEGSFSPLKFRICSSCFYDLKNKRNAQFKPMQLVRGKLHGDIVERSYLYMGEILQMPGHCAVADGSGKIIWGVHTDNFRNPTEEEI